MWTTPYTIISHCLLWCTQDMKYVMIGGTSVLTTEDTITTKMVTPTPTVRGIERFHRQKVKQICFKLKNLIYWTLLSLPSSQQGIQYTNASLCRWQKRFDNNRKCPSFRGLNNHRIIWHTHNSQRSNYHNQFNISWLTFTKRYTETSLKTKWSACNW